MWVLKIFRLARTFGEASQCPHDVVARGGIASVNDVEIAPQKRPQLRAIERRGRQQMNANADFLKPRFHGAVLRGNFDLVPARQKAQRGAQQKRGAAAHFQISQNKQNLHKESSGELFWAPDSSWRHVEAARANRCI